MERMNLFQDNNKPQITFYFAECMEFPDYGEYKEFPTLAQAISLFEKCPGTLLNAVRCVGFILHDDSIYDDVKQPLMTSKHVLKDDINYISHYANTTLVQEAIKEAECYLRNKENSKPKVTTGMFDNCDPLPAEMRKNFKFTDEEIRYLSGVGEVYKNYKPTNFEIMQGPMPPAPIQDESGILCFSLENHKYFLNVNVEDERERVKREVNKNSKYTYDWFKEETGDHHWVLYNTDMYEMIRDDVFYLHYKKDSNLAPVIPINASSCYKMFYEIIALNLSNFDTSKMTNMSWMFDNCLSLTTLDLSNFDTSNVTNMSYMFSKCQSLISLDLSNFDTSKVTDMSYMFSYCSRLISLDLSSFDTSNVTDMSYMFEDCSGLTLLNLSNFNTENVTDMHYMFKYCDSLTTINVSNQWNTDSVKFSIKMFKKCYSLPNFNEEKTNVEMAKPVEQGGYLTLKR